MQFGMLHGHVISFYSTCNMLDILHYLFTTVHMQFFLEPMAFLSVEFRECVEVIYFFLVLPQKRGNPLLSGCQCFSCLRYLIHVALASLFLTLFHMLRPLLSP